MAQPIAAWRITYTPGSWLALSGPKVLLVMPAAPAHLSSLVQEIWLDIVDGDSLDSVLRLMAEYGIDAMPDFAALVRGADGVTGLARGSVRIVDAESGESVVDGEGRLTWAESALDEGRRLRVDVEPADQGAVAQLPLVVGAVTASALYISSNDDDLIHFPVAGEAEAASVPVESSDEVGQSEREVAPVEESAPVEEEAPAESELPAAPLAADDGMAEQLPQSMPTAPYVPELFEPEADDVLPDADEALLETGDAVEPTSELSAREPDATEFVPPVEGGLAGALAEPLPDVPVPAPSAPSSANQSDLLDDDEGGTIFAQGIAASHKPQAPTAGQQVLAVICQNGHPNQPGASHCRVCSAPVAGLQQRLVAKPVLAGVHSRFGEFFNVVEGVVVGRAPQATQGPQGAALMRVPSPSSDISRSHLLVTAQNWAIIVTDLHSTNGTTVTPPQGQPFILANGDSVQVELMTVLDLGDGVSLRIEPPRI